MRHSHKFQITLFFIIIFFLVLPYVVTKIISQEYSVVFSGQEILNYYGCFIGGSISGLLSYLAIFMTFRQAEEKLLEENKLHLEDRNSALTREERRVLAYFSIVSGATLSVGQVDHFDDYLTVRILDQNTSHEFFNTADISQKYMHIGVVKLTITNISSYPAFNLAIKNSDDAIYFSCLSPNSTHSFLALINGNSPPALISLNVEYTCISSIRYQQSIILRLQPRGKYVTWDVDLPSEVG